MFLDTNEEYMYVMVLYNIYLEFLIMIIFS